MGKQKGNGLPAKAFLPTHKTRVWFVEATKAKIRRIVKTPDGDVEAQKGDYIVQYGNGATTVMKPDFFNANFEELKNVEEVDERDTVSVINALKEDENE